MAMFVLNYWLREFLLSEIANRFELRYESKQLMLLYYKICPVFQMSFDCPFISIVKYEVGKCKFCVNFNNASKS